jgi:cytochrome c oxidase subunit 1
MAAAAPQAAPAPPTTYLNHDYRWRSWLGASDHKRIAILFLPAIALMLAAAGALGVVMRVELATPAADLLSPDTYAKFFTLHGMVMVWFALIPAVPVTLGNFLLPLMLGARNLAFPRLNLAAFYLYCASAVWMAAVALSGAIDTGWTLYAPYSTQASPTLVAVTAGALLLNCAALLLVAINQIVTVHTMRRLPWRRLPVFAVATYTTAAMLVLATPVLIVALLWLALDRGFHIGMFEGAGAVAFQQMFWLYGGPAVYMMALPAVGILSEVISAMSGKPLFRRGLVSLSLGAIALLAFTVWGRHMQTAGISPRLAALYTASSYAIALPFLIVLLSWLATLYRGAIRFSAALLWALGAVGLVMIGGMAGMILANLAVDRQLHATYFVTGHFHYVAGGVLMAFLAGLHHWWPKITGRMASETAGRVAACVVFAGANLTFLPYFMEGYAGLPRRYAAYPPEYQLPQILSTAGATILVAGYLIAAAGLLWSLWRGPRAGANPWDAAGLEWTVASPPPPENFPEPAATP